MTPLLKYAQAAAITLGIAMATAAAAEPLTVATDTSFAPFEFKKGDSYTGFDVELWAAIAKDLGADYRLNSMDFNGIIPALQTKQIDAAIAAVTINDQRAKVVDFSDPYYDSDFLFLVRADSTLTGNGDLDGKIIAVKTGTSGYQYAKDHFPKAQLRLFPSGENAYLEVMSGRADAAFNDKPNILYFIKTNGGGKVKAVGGRMQAEHYGIVFPKGSPLKDKVNAALARIKSDGTYAAIYRNWFDADPPAQ